MAAALHALLLQLLLELACCRCRAAVSGLSVFAHCPSRDRIRSAAPALRRFMAVFGISMSASVRISQSLGANCPRAARRATFTALALTMTVLVALVSALLGMQVWVALLGGASRACYGSTLPATLKGFTFCVLHHVLPPSYGRAGTPCGACLLSALPCPTPTAHTHTTPQDRWVLLLTDVAPVIKAVLALCPIFAISMLFDGVYTALVSVLRGSGKQTVR